MHQLFGCDPSRASSFYTVVASPKFGLSLYGSGPKTDVFGQVKCPNFGLAESSTCKHLSSEVFGQTSLWFIVALLGGSLAFLFQFLLRSQENVNGVCV